MKNLTKKQKIIIGLVVVALLLITFFMGPDSYFRNIESADEQKIEETKKAQDENMKRITGKEESEKKEDEKDSESEDEKEEPVEEIPEDAFYLVENNIDTPVDNMINLRNYIAKGGEFAGETVYKLLEPYDEDTWIDGENLSISKEEENKTLQVATYPKGHPEEEVVLTFIITDPYKEEVVVETKDDIEEAVKTAKEETTEEEKAEKIEELEKKKDEAIERTSANSGEKDKYLTDPVPEGKPEPVEPEDVVINEDVVYTATLSISCNTILDNFDMFNEEKIDVLPVDGVILGERTVEFFEGESVFDVLDRTVKEEHIHMEYEFTPIYNSVYIEGINNLYEFDCGPLSGWMYKVNGWFPNYGCSRYQLKDGDTINWVYTCDLGADVGDYTMTGGE